MTATLRFILAFSCVFALTWSVQAAEKVTVKLPNGVATQCDVVKVSPAGAVLKAAGKDVTLPLDKMSAEEVLACHKAVADTAPAQSRFDMGSYFMKKQQWEQAEQDLNAAVKLDAALKDKADPLLQAIAVVKELNGGKEPKDPKEPKGGAGFIVIGPDGKPVGMKKEDGSSGNEDDEEDFAKRFMKREVPARTPAEMKQFLDERLAELKKVIGGGEWRMIETQHFYCFYNGTPEKHKAISGWNEFLYARLCEVLKHKEGDKLWNNKMPMYYFTKYGDFQRFAAEVDKSPGAAFSGGYFSSRGREVHVCIPFMTERLNSEKAADRMARSTLHHEGTHAFLQLTGEDVQLNRWLHEGMAQFIEFLYDGLEDPNGRGNSPERKQRADYLGTAVKKGGVPTWEAMRNRPMGGTDIEGYAFAWSRFEFLYRSFPKDAIPKMVRAIKAGKSEEDAMKEAFGQPMAKLEAVYQTWLKDKTKGGFFKLD